MRRKPREFVMEKKLSKTQAELLEAIKNSCGKSDFVSCAEVKDKALGYKAIRLSTVNALVKKGFISAKVINDRVELIKTYDFGREYRASVAVDVHFEFSLSSKKEIEFYFDYPQKASEKRIDMRGSKKYYVY